MAYHSNESGHFEVYVRPFPGPGGKWQVSAGSGFIPAWSKRARELFYVTEDGIMVVSYSVNQAEFVPSKPRLWAAKKDFAFFDVAPDGKRLALVLNEESNQKEPKGPTQVTFVLNFFDELRRRAPVGGK